MFSFSGSIGVNLFFLLSGASLTHRWQNRWNLKEYVKGRILAIYPDFWVIFFSLFVYGEVLHGNNASVPKWKLVFSIIGVDGYMQQFTSTFYKIGEWFLGCLLILYFLFPIFRYFVSPNRRTFFWGAILFSFWLIWPSLCLPYDGNHMVLGQAFVFWVGMLLSQLFDHKCSCKQLVSCGAICGVLALLYVPTKYMAFFSAIFIILFAGVSPKKTSIVHTLIHTLFLKAKLSYFSYPSCTVSYCNCSPCNSVCLASNLYVHRIFHFLYHIISIIKLYFEASRVVA